MPLENDSLLINRYKILETIAKGGMGAVYRAMDLSLGVMVAVKENLLSSDEFSRQFRREATILASLRHPNLPRVTDHFSIPGQGQYLIMDFIEGEDLRSRIQHRGQIPESDVIRIGIAICDALQYLHHLNPPIVHRDIKPGNIKIDPSGKIFLVDFGLAKIVQENLATTTGAQSLTPGFAPPEQYGKGTDFRSDLYALGATLYAALTGRIPEDGINRALGSARLTPIRVYQPDVTQPVAIAVEKAMEINPGDRFSSVASFKSALIGSEDETRISPQNMENEDIHNHINHPLFSSYSQQEKKSSRMPSVFIGLGVGMVVLGIFAFLIFRMISNMRIVIPTNSPPISTTSPASGNIVDGIQTQSDQQNTQSPFPPTETNIPAVQPTALGGDNGVIIFVSLVENIPQVFRMNADGSTRTQLTNLADGACDPDLDPSSLRMVFITPCMNENEDHIRSAMWLMNLDGTGMVPLRTVPGGDFDPAWSPDGETILFASHRDGLTHIYQYVLSDNNANRLTSPASYDYSPSWSPDGSQIAFVSLRNGSEQIFLMNADGSNVREFSPLNLGRSSHPAWSPDGQIIAFSLGNQNPVIAARRISAGAQVITLNSDYPPSIGISFSPDGFWVIFGHSGELIIMTSNGGEPVSITPAGAYDFDPVWGN